MPMKHKNQPDHQYNESIHAKQVLVIDTDGTQLGTMATGEALRLAQEKDLDLVVVNEKASPPVCRIMDYGKYRYALEKRSQKPSKQSSLKELKMRYTIEEHDYQVRVQQAQRFLKAGDKVKVTITFRGRENQHKDLGRRLLERMAAELQDFAQVEQALKLEGNNMVMLFAPKGTSSKVSKKPKVEPQLASVKS